MRTWTFESVRPAGDGPWTDEPDKAQWVDEATGLDCLAVRNWLSGAWCGYVGVPPSHPWHGQRPDNIHADVHGNVNFGGPCTEGGEEGPYICHVPDPGRPHDVWWLGFDCSHGWDFAPNLVHYLDVLDPGIEERFFDMTTYRTFAYIQAEVTRLAAQAAEATKSNNALRPTLKDDE